MSPFVTDAIALLGAAGQLVINLINDARTTEAERKALEAALEQALLAREAQVAAVKTREV